MNRVKNFEQWKLNEDKLNEEMPQIESKETTVGELMTWYTGPQWYEADSGTANAMWVDTNGPESGHAEDDGKEGQSHLDDLKQAESENISVHSEDSGNAWDCSFDLESNGRTYSFQATVKPFEDNA